METAMLKKLRLKFISLNMITVAVVLAVVFTTICVINYQQSTASVYDALDNAINHTSEFASRTQFNDGTLGTFDKNFEGTIENAPSVSDNIPPENMQDNAMLTPPEIGGKRDRDNSVIPVAVYLESTEGQLNVVSATTTASIAEDILAEASTVITQRGEGSGFLDAFGLFYAQRTIAGSTYVAFADASAASSWQSLALTLAGVGAAAIVVFFVISVFFSRWALRPVARAWNQQRQFIADASHELKTPLTVILANNAILREHPERSLASQDQWIESTQTEAERMQELVCDMLDLAQPASASPTYEQKRVDLSDLVEGDLLQFESVAFERNVALASNIDHGVYIMGNTTRLHRLVATLLDNACKYVDESGTVNVMLHQTVRQVELSIHNTGTAIAQDDLPHVFDRFYRADKARTRSEGSYGLGLAIAQEIAQEHGGTIEATSVEGQGTTFAVTLPLPKASAAQSVQSD